MKFKCVNCGSLVGEDEGFFCHKCTKEMAAKNKLTVVTEHKSPETKGGCGLSLGAVSHDQPHSIPLRDNSFVQPLAKETKE